MSSGCDEVTRRRQCASSSGAGRSTVQPACSQNRWSWPQLTYVATSDGTSGRRDSMGASLGRADVRVQVEEVGGVVGALHLAEAAKVVRGVRGVRAGRVAEEVDEGAAAARQTGDLAVDDQRVRRLPVTDRSCPRTGVSHRATP